jgi:hypothetical protein
MDERINTPVEGNEPGEARSSEQQDLENATLDPRAQVEQSGDIQQAEDVQESFTRVVENAEEQVGRQPQAAEGPFEQVSTSGDDGGEQATPINLPDVQAVAAVSQPIPSEAQEVGATPQPIPRLRMTVTSPACRMCAAIWTRCRSLGRTPPAVKKPPRSRSPGNAVPPARQPWKREHKSAPQRLHAGVWRWMINRPRHPILVSDRLPRAS